MPVAYVVLHGAFDLQHYKDLRAALLARSDFELLFSGIEGVAEVTLFRLRALSECRPVAPADVRSEVEGRTVMLAWRPGADSSYRLEVGSKPGQADVLTADIERGATGWRTTGVIPGSYFLRVRAVNACGGSNPSNELIVRVR